MAMEVFALGIERKDRKGWRGKGWKDSEERIARKGWRGKEGKDSEERTKEGEERMARKG